MIIFHITRGQHTVLPATLPHVTGELLTTQMSLFITEKSVAYTFISDVTHLVQVRDVTSTFLTVTVIQPDINAYEAALVTAFSARAGKYKSKAK